MKRVRAVEDYADDTMLIQGRNGHKAQVSTVPAPNLEIKGIEVEDKGEDDDMHKGELKAEKALEDLILENKEINNL
jgi:hypothetical protein